METKKVLAKYDIRGIQAFVFRTNKLKEIKAVQNLPEEIVFKALINAAGKYFNADIKGSELKNNGIEVLDKAGGNAFVIFDNVELYRSISRFMAFDILEKTYSLKLLYTFVECTGDFYSDYTMLNDKLGKLKSEMPEVCHIGAFPVCRQDDVTGFPIAGKIKEHGKTSFITEESALKRKYAKNSGQKIDDFILEKGVDSHIAVIHIDGNNMGNRINDIIRKMSYDNAAEEFSKIKVRASFAEVCGEMETVTESFRNSDKNTGNKKNPVIHAVIQAGDDITYITRADIALSFTKIFLEKVSQKYMYGSDSKYLISACAGIAFCNSHFPFSDAYTLAENCCASAKRRAKNNKAQDGYIGNWIDFEICTHIKNVDLQQSREKYGKVDNTELNVRPYCVKHPKYQNADYDFEEKFEKYLCFLINPQKSNELYLNRSRAKELRNAYSDGKNAVKIFEQAAKSRDYSVPELYSEIDGVLKASLYDAIEIMDLYTDISTAEAVK